MAIAVLLAGSWSMTVVLDESEHLYVLPDSIIKHLLLFATLIVLFFCLEKVKCLQQIRRLFENNRLYFLLLVMLITASACIAVLQVGPQPAADQTMVSDVAVQILNGDLSSFTTGEYMDRYPHQKGIVVIFSLIYSFVGQNNYSAIEFINLLALIVACILMLQLAPPGQVRNYTLMGLLLFIPMWSYTIFVYGTILGFMFSLLSIWSLKKFHCNRQFRLLILCVFAAFIATICKSNYLIFAVAVIILLLAEVFIEHRYQAMTAVILLMFLFVSKENILNHAIYSLSGTYDVRVEKTIGVPSLGWVVMGLQDDGSRAEGWFNGYTWYLYIDSNYDPELMDEELREDLQERIVAFTEDPSYAARFFLRKTLTQWCEPTFQGIWILEVADSGNTYNPLYEFIVGYQSDGPCFRNFMIEFMNIFQSVIYLGAFLYVLFYENKRGIFPLWGIIAFFGGFLFHLFWEAKGEYTWVYFVLLIPYAAEGITAFTERCVQQYDSLENKKCFEKL